MHTARFLNRRSMALAAAVPALLTLAITGTAQASPSDSHGNSNPPPRCPSATLCTYQNASFNAGGGNWWYYSYNDHSNGHWFYVGASANDQISSYYNNRAWWSYLAINCPADRTYIGGDGGHSESNLANLPNSDGIYNDSMSAIGFATSASQQAGHFPAHGQC